MSFLALIPHVKAQGVNLQTSGILLGGAHVMAASLLAHALARQLGIQDTGVIYIHHDRQDLGSFAYGRFTPAQRRGSVFINRNDYSSKNPYALSLQPTASCHLHFSLIIRFDGKRMPRQSKLASLLANARFAGGQVIAFGEPQWVKSEDLAHELANTIKTGLVVLDRQDVLQAYQQAQSLNRLQAFTRLLALTKDGLDHAFGSQHYLSFLSATNLGYALLEAPTMDRTGIRQAYRLDGEVMPTPHAYAEPLIGLVQYVSIRQLLNFEKNHKASGRHEDERLSAAEANASALPDVPDLPNQSNQPKEFSPLNPIAQPLRQVAENLAGLFWQYAWQTHEGGDIFLLQQTFSNPL